VFLNIKLLRCSKEYKAKRKHSETCSEACRAQKNANKRAMKMIAPVIIAEATPVIIQEFIDEHKGYDTCCHCNNYKVVTDCFSKHFPLPIKLCVTCNTDEILDSQGRCHAKRFIEADNQRVKNGGLSFKDMMRKAS
jgi:hypothetical protein